MRRAGDGVAEQRRGPPAPADIRELGDIGELERPEHEHPHVGERDRGRARP